MSSEKFRQICGRQRAQNHKYLNAKALPLIQEIAELQGVGG